MTRSGDTPKAPNVLGGDPDLNALLFEAIDRVATPNAREKLLANALDRAGEVSLPADILPLLEFVVGPLHRAALRSLGPDAAGALVSDMRPLLERVHRIRSSIPPASMPPPSAPSSPGFTGPFGRDRFSGGEGSRAESADAFHAAEDTSKRKSAPTLPPSGLFRGRGSDGSRPTPLSIPKADYKHGTLPYAEAAQAQHHVLVVDDDVVFLRGLSRLMRASGLDVLTAPDGGSALRICEKVRPALVVSDLDMPSPNGLELAAAIAERMGEDAPPVILLTGTATPPTGGVGVTKVLTKSIRPDELLAEVAPLLPGHDD